MIVDVHSHCWPKPDCFSPIPVTTVAETVAGLRGLCDIRIDRFSLPREEVDALIYRDALSLLGLPDPRHARVVEVAR
jgi:hypothetical protein